MNIAASAQTCLPASLSTGTYQATGGASGELTNCSSVNLNANSQVLLEAGSSIVLTPGFTASAVNSATSLQAVIGTGAYYQLTTTAGAGGAISPPSGLWYSSGSSVWVNAAPNTGYYFQDFSGTSALNDVTITPSPLTINAPESVGASFYSPPASAMMGTSSYLQANLSWMPFSYYNPTTLATTNNYFSENGVDISCRPAPPSQSASGRFWASCNSRASRASGSSSNSATHPRWPSPPTGDHHVW
jgi:hypothetical protein